LPEAVLDVYLQVCPAGSVGTLACVPLFVGETLAGALLASSADRAAFTESRQRLLLVLAEQAALEINNIYQSRCARNAEHVRNKFLSLVTHELRAPFNSINGYLDLLLEGLAGELTAQQQEFVARARAGSEYLYALLEDLLLIARADAGQLRLKREPVVLSEVVHEVLEGQKLAARDADIVLQVSLSPVLPRLYADPVRLQQILRNLLGNAVRFTAAGGRVLLQARVLPSLLGEEVRWVEISVQDTGYGIAPEYQERIFERFFQISAGGGRVSGQGLGLAVVKMLVELHDGSVQVESHIGQGSVFRFTLPALS
jgi:signal transduction histidine kinase